ncbi:hypothetical protein B0H10DRAFT_1965105 [Mycena sp. CBHHK59/15]|nr:hypothetical protein B0H10DRAFT_1965105 [Mycena sp. CBHHK59/15]
MSLTLQMPNRIYAPSRHKNMAQVQALLGPPAQTMSCNCTPLWASFGTTVHSWKASYGAHGCNTQAGAHGHSTQAGALVRLVNSNAGMHCMELVPSDGVVMHLSDHSVLMGQGNIVALLYNALTGSVGAKLNPLAAKNVEVITSGAAVPLERLHAEKCRAATSNAKSVLEFWCVESLLKISDPGKDLNPLPTRSCMGAYRARAKYKTGVTALREAVWGECEWKKMKNYNRAEIEAWIRVDGKTGARVKWWQETSVYKDETKQLRATTWGQKALFTKKSSTLYP